MNCIPNTKWLLIYLFNTLFHIIYLEGIKITFTQDRRESYNNTTGEGIAQILVSWLFADI
jgi:hypothetical protein